MAFVLELLLSNFIFIGGRPVVFSSPKVSRHSALIIFQRRSAFWCVFAPLLVSRRRDKWQQVHKEEIIISLGGTEVRERKDAWSGYGEINNGDYRDGKQRGWIHSAAHSITSLTNHWRLANKTLSIIAWCVIKSFAFSCHTSGLSLFQFGSMPLHSDVQLHQRKMYLLCIQSLWFHETTSFNESIVCSTFLCNIFFFILIKKMYIAYNLNFLKL